MILGGDADGNLGDRAILMSMCQALRELEPAIELTVASSNAERARRDYGANVIPAGVRGWGAMVREARRCDLVLCGGGGLFQDDDSLVKMPYWVARLALVRLAGAPVVGYSLGVGPLHKVVSRWLARRAFGMMRRVTVRDEDARRVAEPLAPHGVEVSPDPAIILNVGDRGAARQRLEEVGLVFDGSPIIGVTTRRWFPPKARIVPNIIAARFRRQAPEDASGPLAAALAAVLDAAIDRHGARVVFLPTYTLSHEGDDRVCRMIAEAMRHRDRASTLVVDDPRDYKAVASQLDLLVGGRMHPTIFAASVGTPIIGLAYNQKFDGFFGLTGQTDRLMSVYDFVHHDKAETLSSWIDDALANGVELNGRLDAMRQQVDRTNRDILEEAKR